MSLIGFAVICLLSAFIGRYILQALVQRVMDSRFGLSGKHKLLKEENVHRLMKTIAPPMGIGAGTVAYVHGLDLSAIVIFTVGVILIPGVLFGILRVLRHAAIALDNCVDSIFSNK